MGSDLGAVVEMGGVDVGEAACPFDGVDGVDVLVCLGQQVTLCLESRERRRDATLVFLLVLCLARAPNSWGRRRDAFIVGAVLVAEPDVRLDVLDRIDAPARHKLKSYEGNPPTIRLKQY